MDPTDKAPAGRRDMTESSAQSPTTAEVDEQEAKWFRGLPEDLEARDALAAKYQYLPDYLAKRFAGRGEPIEDLKQVGSIGLLKAIAGFDPRRGVLFTTYATATIVGELKRHFRDKGWALRVPRRLQELGLQVGKVSAELWQELGREPSVPELAARTGLQADEVIEALDASKAYSTTSLDTPATEGGEAHVDTLGEDDASLELLEQWSTIAPAIKNLPVRERQILYLRFFQDQTQAEIAETLDISQMHVSRLLARSLEELRGHPLAGGSGKT
jgi:RNA polymerase sigma-B factor